MNLALILVSLTLFSGFFILIDILFSSKKSDQSNTEKNLKNTIL